MFRRITVGLKGGILRVAITADRDSEVAGDVVAEHCWWVVLLAAEGLVPGLPFGGAVGGPPGRGGCCPDHAGEAACQWLCDCRWLFNDNGAGVLQSST